MSTHPQSLAKERMIGRQQRETFRAAHAAGVKMLFGTDAGVYPHGDNAKQFAKMVELGMTPAEAIRAATSDAAIAINRANDVGQIAPGQLCRYRRGRGRSEQGCAAARASSPGAEGRAGGNAPGRHDWARRQA